MASRLSDSVRLCDVSRKVDAVLLNQALKSLPQAKHATYDCERPDRPDACFEGTRVDLLKELNDWIKDADDGVARFLWLSGIAGVGKTTVARTIAEIAQKRGQLGGQFFFSRRGEAELRDPSIVIPTIAHQLARFDAEFCHHIMASLQEHPDAAQASLKDQLNYFILEPLSKIKRDPDRVILLVFDAFDECEPRGARAILQLLVAALPKLPFFLKLLVTSRPEPHIRAVLVPSTNLQMTALHDIEEYIVKGDILLYLTGRLRGLPKEKGLDLPPDWVTDREINDLTESSGTLFIYAATCLRFLSESLHLRRQLNSLLKIVRTRRHHAGVVVDNQFVYLDGLYTELLRIPLTPANELELAKSYQSVLGSLVLLKDSLPIDALERLVRLDSGDATITLNLLHSVILPPGPPPDNFARIIHPSFPDFLLDPKRCEDPKFYVDRRTHERRMTLDCLRVMNTKLRKGMLGRLDPALLNSDVKDLEAKVRSAYKPELQ